MKTHSKFSIINFITLLILILVFYIVSKSFFNEDKSSYYLKYLFFVLPILFLNIYFGLKNKKIQQNYLIVFITTVFCIYLLEIFLLKQNYAKQNYQFNQNKKAANTLGLDFDDRSQYQVVKDLEEKKAVPSMSRTLIDIEGEKIQTLGGIANRLTVLCNEEGSWVTFNSDRYGFNNPNDLWDKNIDIMILGDSSGLGMCVEQDDNFAGHIRKKSEYNALQVGGTGMGSLFEYVIYREYLSNKNIKNIIIFFLINDIDNLKSELNNNILLKYLSDKNFDQNLESKQDLLDNSLEKHYFNFKKNEFKNNIIRVGKIFHLRDFLKKMIKFNGEVTNTIYEKFDLDESVFDEVLRIYKKIEKEFDGNFYVGFDPVAANYILPEKDKQKLENLRNKIIAKFESNGFKVINFHNSLKDKPVDKILPFGKLVNVENHFTSYAHELFADQILREINQ